MDKKFVTNDCPDCDGEGKILDKTCRRCKGKGTIKFEKKKKQRKERE